jgi:hypothetical protein
MEQNMLLGWGTLALLNAAFANIDGRSPLAYFLGSLFFGPLVTLVLATTTYYPGRGTVFTDIIIGRNRNKKSN